MHESINHLASAFGRFVEAGFAPAEAKYGLLGFWLGPSRLPIKFDAPSGTARQRMLWASDAWAAHFPGLKNPYDDLLQFLDCGGDLGRWENNVLDVILPNGEIWGIPLSTFDALARGSIELPAKVIPERSDCPKCASKEVARLVYGLVDMDTISQELESGRAVLAGCDVGESSPQWHCNSCGNEWGITEWATILAARREREAAALAKREAEVLARGVLEATLRPSGLARCPFCKRSFDTNSAMSWNGTRHLSCGTYLSLKLSETDS
jgi:hypothetical protein